MEQKTANVPRISETPIGINRDDEDLEQFAEEAMTEIASHLHHNEQEAHGLTEVTHTVDELISDENVRSFDIRARPFENPKVTLWLSDCPIWANDSWRSQIYPFGLNAYNGKVTVTFDVRPF